jgi:phosphate transport system permease protein
MTDEPLSPAASGGVPSAREVTVVRTRGDLVYRRMAKGAGAATLLLLGLIGTFLLLEAWPALKDQGFGFFTHFEWAPPPKGTEYGIAAIMYWTVAIAAVALTIAVPASIAAALFITEYAPARLRRLLTSLIDLLAAVPSLIYGMWGLLFLQPRMVGISHWLGDHLGFIPIFKVSNDAVGSSTLIAGTIVSLMVLPICTAIIREVFSQAPPGEKEGALALGSTRWGVIRSVVLPFGRGGIIGGAMLGLGRALGETIAVALIISPNYLITPRIVERGSNSVGALIANNFGEAGSGLGLNALMAAGLMLFIVTLSVNTVAAVVVGRSRSGAGVEI